MLRRPIPSVEDHRVNKFLIGLVAGVVAVPVVAFVLAFFGALPVATSASPLPLERALAETALHAKISAQAPKQIGIPVNEANIVTGAQIYRDHCSECHGLPTQPQPANTAGMFPPVPQFFKHRDGGEHRGQPQQLPANFVTRATAATYWRTRNGIRLTGMPSFEKALTDEQIWQVSLFLASRRNLPAAAQPYLTAGK